MPTIPSFNGLRIVRQWLRWALLIVPVSMVVGLLVALFLWLLDLATQTRWQNPWLLFLLPLAGILIVQLYQRWGKNSEKGNALILDEIKERGEGIPARMTPLILFSTVITHLFGGSAGREGTAVQMGGSISSLFARWYKLTPEDRGILLRCGMSAGFGAVFGTPMAGAVFAFEVLAIGKIRYDAFLPCLLASVLADLVCSACGIQHTPYAIVYSDTGHRLLSFFHLDFLILIQATAAGVLFGLVSYLFIRVSHTIKNQSAHYLQPRWLIPVIGGLLVISISYLLGTFDYLGLGVAAPTPQGVSITSAFHAGGATNWSWFWKLLLTAITLGMGFKGGEVTPLFFIGATLGNVLAAACGAPIDLFAALGFLAVFAGASNTPLACTIMGVEIFGGEHVLYYALACFAAYFCSGQSSIYSSKKKEIA